MASFRLRGALAGVVIAGVAGIIAASPALDSLRGVSLDLLTGLRWRVFGQMHDPAASHVIVVALDEETYRTPPFEGTPNVTWTREIGRVLNAVIDGGVKVVGFDIVFPTSIEQSEIAFGDETLGARVRGFDRDFLRAVALGARAGKVVLGQIQHGNHPLMPSPAQRVAVGQTRNIRALNVFNDPDDVVRRVPATVLTDGAPLPSMALELASRAQGAPPVVERDGSVSLAGYRIPAIVPNTLTLNFDGGADDIPTYGLADLRACLEKGDTEFFKRHFGGKVVLIGTVLEVEDRKITSKRFATAPEGARAARCATPGPSARAPFARDSLPGVYIHATAINNLINRDAVTELGRTGTGLVTFAVAGVASAAALLLTPLAAALAFLAAAITWTAAATIAFRQALALPVVEPLLLGAVALAATIGFRFVVADKDKRLLRQSFSLYLAPAVIEKMLASSTPPALGGESREITVYFSDVAGFSSLSERMLPADLVTLMNRYLSDMTDIIEAHGGFVDKYIGDAIVAVFGAPLDDAHHARHAVLAALRCRARLEEMNRAGNAFFGHTLGQRIGLNSGEALVGNIGSRRRFNYTVMGDTVNLASRLEGANKHFGTTIMASESTMRLAGNAVLWRELDSIRVQGRHEPVRIFEPLAEAAHVTAEQSAKAALYAEALALWRRRDFAGAAERFGAAAASDPVAARFLRRAKACIAHPPDPDWEPVNTLESK